MAHDTDKLEREIKLRLAVQAKLRPVGEFLQELFPGTEAAIVLVDPTRDAMLVLTSDDERVIPAVRRWLALVDAEQQHTGGQG